MIESENIPTLAECLAAADQTKYMTAGNGAVAEIPALLETYYSEGADGLAVIIAADENTFNAAGRAALDAVTKAGIKAATFIFPGKAWIHADYEHVITLKEAFAKAQTTLERGTKLVPVAVGAGTINDLVKRASSELRLPYLCVPTAASVDGYTAYGAALLHEGFKQSMSCEAPLVVAADTAVLAQAPAFLTSSGFGDLAGKLIAGSDWIVADKVYALDGTGALAPGSEKIDAKAWAMVQRPLRGSLAQSVHAAKGGQDAVKVLFEALGITGFALQYMKNSRAVSGCEHMWSHVWEMENLSVNGVPVTHGHKVVMGTLAAAAFTECLFAEKPAPARPRVSWAEREAQVRAAFAGLDKAGAAALKTAREKFIDNAGQAKQLAEGIIDVWDDMKQAVAGQLPPYAELLALLESAGCPVKPAELGLTKERVIAAAAKAQMIRIRFTVLDLAYETGVFDSVLKRMEASPLYLAG